MLCAWLQSGQLKEREDALQQKAAYAAKLETRLLTQQRALEAARRSAAERPQLPPAAKPLHLKAGPAGP